MAPDSLVIADSLPAVERARLHLQLREFPEAYDAAQEAAEAAGLPDVSIERALPNADADADLASILLYRGLSLELQRQFPQAAANYTAFLRLEPASARSVELNKRLPYVQAQSVRTLARDWRDEGILPPADLFADGARFSVGVFPLYNESSLLAMSQMAFGLTGVLSNAVSLLNSFSDKPLPAVPYAHVRWLLDEVLPPEVYADSDTMPVSELSRVLDTDYLAVGRLNEVVGSLTANLTIGQSASMESIELAEVQSSYSQAGLQSLQLQLVMSLADSIQSLSGFNYTPSRDAYADSVSHYLIPDVEQFFDYGYAMEQLLIGDPVEGRVLLLDSELPVAQRDLPTTSAVFVGETPPEDNVFELTATLEQLAVAAQQAYEDSLAAVAAYEDSLRAARPTPVRTIRPTAPSRRTAREVIVGSSIAADALGSAGVGMPRMDVFSTSSAQTEDPRSGKSGTLDPTRQKMGVPIRIEIPVPRVQATEKSDR